MKLFGIVAGLFFGLTLSGQVQSDFVPLKELFKKDFLIGVAVNGRTITGDAGKMVIDNFNTLTCENEMKPQSLLYFPFQRPAGAERKAGRQRQTGSRQWLEPAGDARRLPAGYGESRLGSRPAIPETPDG